MRHRIEIEFDAISCDYAEHMLIEIDGLARDTLGISRVISDMTPVVPTP